MNGMSELPPSLERINGGTVGWTDFIGHYFHVVISSISTFRMDGGEPHLPVLLSLASISARNSFVRL